ncbi:MAG: hypothetical protein QNJ40_14750 [Xanthomonadales bacterium]|nr:hypothetical protein [Xanthomonadales bacterium]
MGRVILLLIVLLGVWACASKPPVKVVAQSPVLVDFSGSWEINYQLSDRVEENANLLWLRALADARRYQGRMDRPNLRLPSLELIRLADSISQTGVMEIQQGKQSIEIKRGEEFPLTCTFGPGGPFAAMDPLGNEVCGWDSHQLVFAFGLEGNLRVIHRLTLASDGDKLNVATTVSGRGADQTFTLNRVYDRFEPLADDYQCKLAVTGLKTCWKGAGDSSSEP